MTSDGDFRCFKPHTPQYKKLKWRVYFPNPENNGPKW